MKKLLFIILAAFLVCSCGAYKRLAYLQDMDALTTYDVTRRPDPRIARGDKLNITVSSSQPVLAAPFNAVAATATYNAVTEQSSYTSTDTNKDGYLVDQKGYINFPVLGPIFVEGMTLEDLTNTITDQIKASNYIKEPIVKVEFLNFQVTVLGEVHGVGNYTISSGSINIFELLAMCGDLTEDAIRDNIWVIRTTGDTRKVYTLNPKSRTIFDSPAFYLQQNDMLYVAPKDNKIDQATTDRIRMLTTPFNIISSFASIAVLILSIFK